MSEVTVVELLKRTRTLIERGWTQGSVARDAAGQQVTSEDPGAARFCLTGALQRACGERLGPVFVTRQVPYSNCRSRLQECIQARYKRRAPSIEAWNDRSSRRKSEVLALIEETIACLK